jgi:hypothetical protein
MAMDAVAIGAQQRHADAIVVSAFRGGELDAHTMTLFPGGAHG